MKHLDLHLAERAKGRETETEGRQGGRQAGLVQEERSSLGRQFEKEA